MKSNKFLLTLAFAAALTGCINDADVTTEGGTSPVPEVKGGNMDLVFIVPNSSNGNRAAENPVEDTEVYQQGTPEEYKVKNVTLYLFDASSKNLKYTIPVAQSELGATTASSGTQKKDDFTIVYPCTKPITVDPGVYDILAVANETQTFNGGQESVLLGQIDNSTYGNGLIENVPENGFIMSNRGSANTGVTVQENTKTKVTINLERVVAKLMLKNQENSYPVTTPKGVQYATVSVNNYKFLNLANKFYTFRHVSTLEDADETPAAPTTYSFGDIASQNGYLIDPYFFDKTVRNATPDFNGGSFYTNHLTKRDELQWAGMAAAGNYASIYCLENCMFRPAQKTTYITGIMLKATFTPEASQTIGEDGNAVQDPLNFEILYYFNYKFYTSLKGVGMYGKADISGLGDTPTDEELKKKQITRFIKTDGGFPTTYYYWIKHLDNNSSTHGVMEFGIVRNNIYLVNITSVKDLGPGNPTITEKPSLEVDFGVYPWIVRGQDVTLE